MANSSVTPQALQWQYLQYVRQHPLCLLPPAPVATAATAAAAAAAAAVNAVNAAATVTAREPSMPDDEALKDFKNDVRTWLELDNTIRRLQAALRERRAAKTVLHDRMTRFMNEYSIEDLNTRDGRLRYHVTYVRAPLSQQVIRDRINAFFQTNTKISDALQGAVFGARERHEHHSIRRLKSSGR
jgi:hypothetical protein